MTVISIKAKGDEEENLKRIAELLSNLPDSKLLKPDLTPAQLKEWEKITKNQGLVAQGWTAKYLTKKPGDSLIEKAKDDGDISKSKADLLLLSVDEHYYRWLLFQEAYPIVEKFFINWQILLNSEIYLDLASIASRAIESIPSPYLNFFDKFFNKSLPAQSPFCSAYDLFAKSVEQEIHSIFSSCLEPYYNFSMPKCRQVSHLIAENLTKTINDVNYLHSDVKKVQKLFNLSKQHLEFSCLGFTLFLCHCYLLTHQAPILKTQLRAYYDCLHKALSKTISVSRRVPSFEWKKGKVAYGSNRGGIYVEP